VSATGFIMIDRRELCERVWMVPIWTLVAEFGVTGDVN
jgi:hypothetical protein